MSKPQKHLVIFTPSGKRAYVEAGTNLLQAARSIGVDVDSVCGGRGICGRCQVVVADGEFAKFGVSSSPEHLSPFSEPEIHYEQKRGLAQDRRLSCHCSVEGDVLIDVPPESQVHNQVVRKAASVIDIALDPIVRLYYVEVVEMDMHYPESDIVRLNRALREQWALENLKVDLLVLTELQGALKEGKFCVTVAVYDDSDIVAIWPGLRTKVYGLAVDVGSTTIAAHLCDLATGDIVASAGAMNPQIRFGEDLMSRVSYVMMNPSGVKDMSQAVRKAIMGLAAQVVSEAGLKVKDILDSCLVANPVMHHLLLGISPVELGGAPFALASDEGITLKASEIDLRFHLGARSHLLPCIAGHVGADTAAVILSQQPQSSQEMTLLVDIGTNAEIVLGNSQRLAACSSPTGPALEGAQISGGQRAAPGAIERVRIDPATLEPRVRVIGCDLWSDEPGFSEAMRSLTVTGICGSGIIEVIAEMYLAGVINSDGQIDGERLQHPRIRADGRTFSYDLFVGDSDKGDVSITITQQDIRAVQLAKAALFAGVQLLMDHLNVNEVNRIGLAGAFGSHIDVKYAMVLGLIPDCLLDKVRSVGNAAGDGALLALLNKTARSDIAGTVRSVEKIETAVEPKFQDYFVDALAIPNKRVAFPKLEQALNRKLEISSKQDNDGRRNKRRRRSA